MDNERNGDSEERGPEGFQIPYQDMFEALGDPAAICDPEERIIRINSHAEEFLGLAAASALGRSFFDFVTPEQRAALAEQVGKRRSGDDGTYDLDLVRTDGTSREVRVTAAPLFDSEGRFLGSLGVFRDISSVKRTEEQLRLSEDRYRNLFDRMLSGFVILEVVRGSDGNTVDFRLVESNPAFEGVTGLPWSQLEGRTVRQLLTDADPVWLGEMERVATTGVASHSDYHVAALGRHFEVIIYRPEAGRIAAILTDISDRKRAEGEKAALEAQLAHAQKMEAIGRLAGGVAHDINNVLGAIMGAASVLSEDVGDETLQADIETILAACRKGSRLTRDLLGFARKGKHAREPVSLNEAVRRVTKLLRRSVPKKISIRTQIDEELSLVEGDISQLESALMNLCINSADAMAGDGQLVIETRNVELGGEPGEVSAGLPPGRYVRLRVSDTGRGMDQEIAARAFEPFFTTKPKGEGTGLGLSMVYGVAQNHGGSLVIDTGLAKGTTMTVLLPATGDLKSKAEVGRASVPPHAVQGPIGILLVDDETLVVRSTKRMLEKLGHEVFTASNGREGLEVYRRSRDRINVVLLDLVMPEMDGVETLNALIELDPEVKVVVVSGYTNDTRIDDLFERGALGFIEKPLDLKVLSRALESASNGERVSP